MPASIPEIPTRAFGKTGLSMPVLTLGCMRFQESWDRAAAFSPASQDNLERLIRHALELGICHLETARGYGTSEAQLGRILPHLPRDRFLLQTKVGPRPTAEEFRGDVEDSLRTLGVSHVDLLALHGINNLDLLRQVREKGGCLDTLVRLREEGIARHIGFSSHGGPKLLLEALQTGVFDYMNLWYSFIYRDNTPVLDEARRRQVGVLIISPNDKGGKLYSPPDKLRSLTAPLSPMQFNDLFTLTHTGVSTLSIGAARPSDLDEHISAVRRATESQSLVLDIAQRMEQEMRNTVGADWADHGLDGLPAWNETPGEINIPVILWLLNLARAYDMVDYARMRYNLLGNGQHWFPGRKADRLEELDPAALQHSLRASPFPDRVVAALHEAHALLGGAEAKRMGDRH